MYLGYDDVVCLRIGWRNAFRISVMKLKMRNLVDGIINVEYHCKVNPMNYIFNINAVAYLQNTITKKVSFHLILEHAHLFFRPSSPTLRLQMLRELPFSIPRVNRVRKQSSHSPISNKKARIQLAQTLPLLM